MPRRKIADLMLAGLWASILLLGCSSDVTSEVQQEHESGSKTQREYTLLTDWKTLPIERVAAEPPYPVGKPIPSQSNIYDVQNDVLLLKDEDTKSLHCVTAVDLYMKDYTITASSEGHILPEGFQRDQEGVNYRLISSWDENWLMALVERGEEQLVLLWHRPIGEDTWQAVRPDSPFELENPLADEGPYSVFRFKDTDQNLALRLDDGAWYAEIDKELNLSFERDGLSTYRREKPHFLSEQNIWQRQEINVRDPDYVPRPTNHQPSKPDASTRRLAVAVTDNFLAFLEHGALYLGTRKWSSSGREQIDWISPGYTVGDEIGSGDRLFVFENWILYHKADFHSDFYVMWRRSPIDGSWSRIDFPTGGRSWEMPVAHEGNIYVEMYFYNDLYEGYDFSIFRFNQDGTVDRMPLGPRNN